MQQYLQFTSANITLTLMVLRWTTAQMQTARHNLCHMPVNMKQIKGEYW
jgi:hypothetical protein